MELCSSGHEEICYNSRKCPLCLEIDEKESLEKDLKNELEIVNGSLDDSYDKVNKLLAEIEELKKDISENS